MTHKDNNCDYGKVVGGFHIDDCTCPTTPAHEWREEIAPRFGSKHAKAIEHFIENLLTTHTAHLVERMKAITKDLAKEVDNPTIYYGTDVDITEVPLGLTAEMKGFINGWKTAIKQFDQAIDIVKGNK